jgi:hypothetical protein
MNYNIWIKKKFWVNFYLFFCKGGPLQKKAKKIFLEDTWGCQKKNATRRWMGTVLFSYFFF